MGIISGIVDKYSLNNHSGFGKEKIFWEYIVHIIIDFQKSHTSVCINQKIAFQMFPMRSNSNG